MARGCPVRLSSSCSFSLSCSATSSTFSSARMAAISLASLLSSACCHTLMSWRPHYNVNKWLANAAAFYTCLLLLAGKTQLRGTDRTQHPQELTVANKAPILLRDAPVVHADSLQFCHAVTMVLESIAINTAWCSKLMLRSKGLQKGVSKTLRALQ